MDLPGRCPDARHRLARRDRARNRAAARRELVSGGGMAVNSRGWKWSGTDGLWRGFTAFELATGAYLALARGAVLLPFRRDGVRGWPRCLTPHALVLALGFAA